MRLIKISFFVVFLFSGFSLMVLSLVGCELCPIGGGCTNVRYRDKDSDNITGYTTVTIKNIQRIVLIGNDYDYLVDITATSGIILDNDFEPNYILKKDSVWPYPGTYFHIVSVQGAGSGFTGEASILYENKDKNKIKLSYLKKRFPFPANSGEFECSTEEETCSIQYTISGSVYAKRKLKYSSAIHKLSINIPLDYQIQYELNALIRI